MAAEILTSDLITAYKNKQRVRTMNSNGSVICTTALDNNEFINKDNGSVLHVALIPVSAVIHSINVVFSAAIQSTKGVVQIGFYGIHKHSGDFVLIKKDVVDDASFADLETETYKNIWPRTLLGKTVYEMLCNGNPSKPIETFEQFKDCENVVLTLTVKTKNDTSSPTECAIQVMYTPGAPSTTSLTKLTLDKE